MNFWLRNLILAIILSGLAWAFFANQDFLLSLDGSLGQAEVEEKPSVIDTPPKEAYQAVSTTKPKVATPTTTNKAAIGLSKFYANLHGEIDGDGPKIKNNIVYLPEPKGDLEKILQAREMIVRPYKKNWHGSIKSRPFRKGQALNIKLSEYADKGGVELIWWLNRDFIVKDPFRIEKDLLSTAYQIGKAVEGHFEEGLAIYFCNRQRAIVVIEDEENLFLDEECILQGSDKLY